MIGPSQQLLSLDPHSQEAIVLQHGRNLSVRMPFDGVDAVVKCFPPPSSLYRIGARLLRTHSKPQRAFEAAAFLHSRVPDSTPEPLAWCVAPDGSGRFVSRYVDGMKSLTATLVERYNQYGPGPVIMDLLERVAAVCRKMHDAGFFHGDLGNQNIMISNDGRILIIDLNRCRLFPEGGVPLRLRARDLSRIALPSDFLRCFFEMYWQDSPPSGFLRAERRYRARFAFHSATRRLRHPFRPRRKSPEPEYPSPNNLWIWDPRSEQALVTLLSRDRRRYQSISRVTTPLLVLLKYWFRILSNLRTLRHCEFASGITAFASRVRVSIAADPGRFGQELALLDELHCPNVHLRFYAHETQSSIAFKLQAVQKLRERGFNIAISLVQCRDSILHPDTWAQHCTTILDAVHEQVEWVEYLHAVNRVKWGIWNYRELASLLDCLPDFQKRYPATAFLVPSVIDFEWDYFAGAVHKLPKCFAKSPLAGASAELYIDRRGAPEAFQGRYDAVGKLRLLRAILETTPAIEDRLIVTEFNWPLEHTGVWSPVGAPYTSPGPRLNDPSVSPADCAAYLIRYLLLGIASGMAHEMVFWSLAAHGFGLVDPGSEPSTAWKKRPGFFALACFFDILGDATFERAISSSGLQRLLLFRKSDGNRIAVAWQAGLTEAPLCPNLPFTPTETLDLFGASIDSATPLSGNPIYFFESHPRHVPVSGH